LQDAFDGAGLRADGLIVPHHGSRTSSTEGFLQAVQPRWALAQAGYRNRYGHPAPAVVQRYADRGIPLLSSPWCGALLWQGAQPQCWRVVQPRHWHDQPAAQGPSVP
jgi:competence protein ComEC